MRRDSRALEKGTKELNKQPWVGIYPHIWWLLGKLQENSVQPGRYRDSYHQDKPQLVPGHWLPEYFPSSDLQDCIHFLKGKAFSQFHVRSSPSGSGFLWQVTMNQMAAGSRDLFFLTLVENQAVHWTCPLKASWGNSSLDLSCSCWLQEEFPRLTAGSAASTCLACT